MRRPCPSGRAGWLAAVALPTLIPLAGCGATTATVEPAAPLSPVETKRLVDGVRAAWSSGGEVVPDASEAVGSDSLSGKPDTRRPDR